MHVLCLFSAHTFSQSFCVLLFFFHRSLPNLLTDFLYTFSAVGKTCHNYAFLKYVLVKVCGSLIIVITGRSFNQNKIWFQREINILITWLVLNVIKFDFIVWCVFCLCTMLEARVTVNTGQPWSTFVTLSTFQSHHVQSCPIKTNDVYMLLISVMQSNYLFSIGWNGSWFWYSYCCKIPYNILKILGNSWCYLPLVADGHMRFRIFLSTF